MRSHGCCLLAVACVTTAIGAEVWVGQGTTGTGAGTSNAPFATIGQALKAARGGDTITVRAGTYREAVTLSLSGTAVQPTVLRAAPGQRVVLSGFAPLRDWQPSTGGVWTTVIAEPPGDLYVGLRPQAVARWPDLDQPMRVVGKYDSPSRTFVDPAELPDVPFLKAVAAAPKSAMLFCYVAQGNFFRTLPLERVDWAQRAFTFASVRDTAAIKGDTGRNRDRYQLVNHPALIRQPGQWAFETLAERQIRVHFRPVDPADLARTQYRENARCVLLIGGRREGVSHLRIEGLEICGAAGYGVQIERAEDVTVTRCLVHNNGRNGVWSRRSNNVTVKNNVVLANGTGVSIISADKALVEENEVALNEVDGIVVAGNVSGRPDGEPETRGVTLRRNYVHHHLLLSHPDNIQTYRGVRDLVIEDCVLLFGGQSLMTEEVDGAVLRNSVAVGAGAIAVIFGHANSHRWTVENCTVGLGGWGAFSLTGRDYRLRNNIIWNNPLGLVESLSSDWNVYWSWREAWPVALVSAPRWHAYTSLAEVAGATGQESHAQRGRPAFRCAPACQAAAAGSDSNRADRLTLRLGAGYAEAGDFPCGDRIEINGDGVLRRVTESASGTIRFEPPLPCRPLRDALVWNWKAAAAPALDLRPAAGAAALTAGEGGRAVGAALDIPAFQRGDFDGDGRRDIPDLPEDLKAAMPNPNAPVVPLHGS